MSYDDYEDYFFDENTSAYSFYIHCLNIKQFGVLLLRKRSAEERRKAVF
jgi:hypothetical protein